jgi:superfamily II DNA or RNA helicase
MFKQALTYISPFADEDGNRKVIKLYSEGDNYLGLPIEFIKTYYPQIWDIAIQDDRRTTTGELKYTRLPDPDHPAVKEPELQREFIDGLRKAVLDNDNAMGVLFTGGGKTASTLSIAAELGYRTLVCVQNNEQRKEWLNEAKMHLGLKDEDVGIIQQDKCEYEGKSVVVALLPTLSRRSESYKDELYQAFGTIIVDESSTLGTNFFSDVLPTFTAKHRICVDATPKRKDGADVVQYVHVGHPAIEVSNASMPVKVIPIKYYTKTKLWGADDKQRMVCLTRDKSRNQVLVDYIKVLYKANRQVLIVSEKIAQLETLMDMCEKQGIAKDAMGQFTAERQVFNELGRVTGKKKIPDEELAEAKKKQLLFATIGKVKRSFNEPRLDTGLEASPLWQGTQVIGRIRRFQKGKLFPKWITVVDMKCEFSQARYANRAREYLECGAEIVEAPQT